MENKDTREATRENGPSSRRGRIGIQVDHEVATNARVCRGVSVACLYRERVLLTMGLPFMLGFALL